VAAILTGRWPVQGEDGVDIGRLERPDGVPRLSELVRAIRAAMDA